MKNVSNNNNNKEEHAVKVVLDKLPETVSPGGLMNVVTLVVSFVVVAMTARPAVVARALPAERKSKELEELWTTGVHAPSPVTRLQFGEEWYYLAGDKVRAVRPKKPELQKAPPRFSIGRRPRKKRNRRKPLSERRKQFKAQLPKEDQQMVLPGQFDVFLYESYFNDIQVDIKPVDSYGLYRYDGKFRHPRVYNPADQANQQWREAYGDGLADPNRKWTIRFNATMARIKYHCLRELECKPRKLRLQYINSQKDEGYNELWAVLAAYNNDHRAAFESTPQEAMEDVRQVISTYSSSNGEVPEWLKKTNFYMEYVKAHAIVLYEPLADKAKKAIADWVEPIKVPAWALEPVDDDDEAICTAIVPYKPPINILPALERVEDFPLADDDDEEEVEAPPIVEVEPIVAETVEEEIDDDIEHEALPPPVELLWMLPPEDAPIVEVEPIAAEAVEEEHDDDLEQEAQPPVLLLLMPPPVEEEEEQEVAADDPMVEDEEEQAAPPPPRRSRRSRKAPNRYGFEEQVGNGVDAGNRQPVVEAAPTVVEATTARPRRNRRKPDWFKP